MQLSQLWNLSQIWLFQVSVFIAQSTPTPTPTPTSSPSADVELLKNQILFLQDARNVESCNKTLHLEL
jgi:hypothetical protein